MYFTSKDDSEREINQAFLKQTQRLYLGKSLVTLLSGFEFEEVKTGKTAGSRRRFVNSSEVI